jgi:hypothetical protein
MPQDAVLNAVYQFISIMVDSNDNMTRQYSLIGSIQPHIIHLTLTMSHFSTEVHCETRSPIPTVTTTAWMVSFRRIATVNNRMVTSKKKKKNREEE